MMLKSGWAEMRPEEVIIEVIIERRPEVTRAWERLYSRLLAGEENVPDAAKSVAQKSELTQSDDVG